MNPIVIGGLLGVLSVWLLIGIRDFANFEAFQWWVYINYDFTPRFNPFTIGPFLAGIVAGYAAGFLTHGLYEKCVANAVKANLLAGALFYLTILSRSFLALVTSEGPYLDLALVLTLQPLLFIAIPFTLVFMGEGVIAGPVGQYLRRKLLDEDPRTPEDRSSLGDVTVRSSLIATAIVVVLIPATWAALYAMYLVLGP